MFELRNETDRSVIADGLEYEDIQDALRNEMKRIKAAVGRNEDSAYELVSVYTNGVYVKTARLTRARIEWL